MGYYQAGFDVVGIDILHQPKYPFEFHQGDALDYLVAHHHEFDAFHASPPYQEHTKAGKQHRAAGKVYGCHIEQVRAAFEATGKPWVIENVPGSPLRDPVELCGCMFPNLKTYRPRLFEANIELIQPEHDRHLAKTTKMGRPPKTGEYIHVVGHFSGVDFAREAMGIDWLGRDELAQAIPPAYTKFVGEQLLESLRMASAIPHLQEARYERL